MHSGKSQNQCRIISRFTMHRFIFPALEDREDRHSRVGFLKSRFVLLLEESVAVRRGRFTRTRGGEAGGRRGCNMVSRSHWLS